MASSVIHWAIANVYLQSQPQANREEFKAGVAEPDIAAYLQGDQKKALSHYTDLEPRQQETAQNGDFCFRTMCRTKVNLYRFLRENDLGENDFLWGYFCHLVGDYYFFNYFIDPKFFDDDRHKFRFIYSDYDRVARPVEERYSIANIDNPWADLHRDGEPQYFTLEALFDFIDRVGSIDLNKLRTAILNSSDEAWRSEIEHFYTEQQPATIRFPLPRL